MVIGISVGTNHWEDKKIIQVEINPRDAKIYPGNARTCLGSITIYPGNAEFHPGDSSCAREAKETQEQFSVRDGYLAYTIKDEWDIIGSVLTGE